MNRSPDRSSPRCCGMSARRVATAFAMALSAALTVVSAPAQRSVARRPEPGEHLCVHALRGADAEVPPRSIEIDGRRELILADVSQPGRLVRIAALASAGTLRIRIDGERAPAWSLDLAAILAGTVPPPDWVDRVETTPSGGALHGAVEFAERLLVTVDAPRAVVLATVVHGFPAARIEALVAREVEVVAASGPGIDPPVIEVEGLGRLVGIRLEVENPVDVPWDGGDVVWHADREHRWSGAVGLAPFFLGVPGDHRPVDSGCVDIDRPADGGQRGRTVAIRRLLGDAIPFYTNFRLALRPEPWGDQPVRYRILASFEAEPQARFRVIAAAAAGAAPEPTDPPSGRPLRYEGEELEIVAASGGEHRRQSLDARRWSGGAQLWWIDPPIGARLTLAVPVERAGRYRIQAGLTTARDYGRVRFHLDGEPLGPEVELYSRQIGHTGIVELGVARLDAGARRLEVEITGRHPQAADRRMFGLDVLRLVPVVD